MHALLQLRKISDLNDMFANEMVDVLGVIDTVQDSAIIQTKDGRDVSRQPPLISVQHLILGGTYNGGLSTYYHNALYHILGLST